MMMGKDIAIAILKKKKGDDDEDEMMEGYEAAAGNIMSAMKSEDPKELAYALKEFMSMYSDYGSE